MWYEFKFVMFCFWGGKMIRNDIFECLWLNEEVQNEDIEVGFLLSCTNWNQILSYDICVPA